METQAKSYDRIERAARAIREELGDIQAGAILGSGLGEYAAALPGAKSMPYSDIPGFPRSTVLGHAGEMVVAQVGGCKTAFLRGRFHAYEGYDLADVTFPVRVLYALGARTLIVTNAAGGIDLSFKPGDLMLIEDHISFAENPLCGQNLEAFGPRFPDMSRAYDRQLQAKAKDVAKKNGIDLKTGVYFYMRGPSFETPAEIRALRALGASAVGMSTVAEVVIARHSDMRVLGISCITNMAAGVLDQSLSHAEVIQMGEKAKDSFATLLDGVLKEL